MPLPEAPALAPAETRVRRLRKIRRVSEISVFAIVFAAGYFGVLLPQWKEWIDGGAELVGMSFGILIIVTPLVCIISWAAGWCCGLLVGLLYERPIERRVTVRAEARRADAASRAARGTPPLR